VAQKGHEREVEAKERELDWKNVLAPIEKN